MFHRIILWYCFLQAVQSERNESCGYDNSPVSAIYDGSTDARRYPWMGLLYYPTNDRRLVGITVVLVTRQNCLASALEIDKIPKHDFRSRARVVLGYPCGDEEHEIRVRDYSYHPEYRVDSLNALAIIQLETDNVLQELRPICGPPEVFFNADFYAMTMYAGCAESRVRLYKVRYVKMDQCQHYYRKADLDMANFWPTNTLCAHAISGGKCVWRSGTVLAMKQHGRWRLLGFGVVGPGCGAPARFIDYGNYYPWVRRTVMNIGFPAVSRVAENSIILRRSSSNIQRFGPCDTEETRHRLYSDKQRIIGGHYKVTYNLSLYTNIEYSCILFKAEGDSTPYTNDALHKPPRIRIRRWCAGPADMCHGFQYADIHFHVEITYHEALHFNVTVFGREPKIISPAKAMVFYNKYVTPEHPHIPETLKVIHDNANNTSPCGNSAWLYAMNYCYERPRYVTYRDLDGKYHSWYKHDDVYSKTWNKYCK